MDQYRNTPVCSEWYFCRASRCEFNKPMESDLDQQIPGIPCRERIPLLAPSGSALMSFLPLLRFRASRLGLLFWLAAPLVLPPPLVAEDSVLMVQVSHRDGYPLRGVGIGTKGSGSMETTDGDGKAWIQLVEGVHPGDRVTLLVRSKAQDPWFFVRPPEGRTRVRNVSMKVRHFLLGISTESVVAPAPSLSARARSQGSRLVRRCVRGVSLRSRYRLGQCWRRWSAG